MSSQSLLFKSFGPEIFRPTVLRYVKGTASLSDRLTASRMRLPNLATTPSGYREWRGPGDPSLSGTALAAGAVQSLQRQSLQVNTIPLAKSTRLGLPRIALQSSEIVPHSNEVSVKIHFLTLRLSET